MQDSSATGPSNSTSAQAFSAQAFAVPGAAAAKATAVKRIFLVFRVANAWMAVDAEAVDEVADLSEVTPLPRMPKHIPGLIFLRGHAVPLLDLGIFLGLEDALTGADDDLRPTRVVVLGVDGMRVGLISSHVRGVSQRRVAELREPEALGARLRAFSAAQVQDHTELIAVLDIDSLLAAAKPKDGV